MVAFIGPWEFLLLVLIIAFPAIAIWFPQQLAQTRSNEVIERVEDNAESLERDSLESMQQQSQDAQDALDARATVASDRLARRKDALLKQFGAMETALSKIQSQSQWLTSQINSLSAIAPNANSK